jgi:hypothetical protein
MINIYLLTPVPLPTSAPLGHQPISKYKKQSSNNHRAHHRPRAPSNTVFQSLFLYDSSARPLNINQYNNNQKMWTNMTTFQFQPKTNKQTHTHTSRSKSPSLNSCATRRCQVVQHAVTRNRTTIESMKTDQHVQTKIRPQPQSRIQNLTNTDTDMRRHKHNTSATN